MDITNLAYLLCSYTPGLGPMKMLQIEERVSDLSFLLEGKENELKAQIGHELAKSIISTREGHNFSKILQDLQSKNIHYLAKSDPRYPQALQNIPDPPIGIFVKGNIELINDNQSKIAIVGTRKTSQYGINATSLLISQMAPYQPVIVSGMAIGIDSVAHLEALRHKTPTIAVLGCGVNVIYPRENTALYEKILESSGAIISEFTPDQTVTKGLFINRNRIISALSERIIIVEGQLKSGSLITARFALDQGKEVFAVPGPITSINSEGPNDLIKNGATPLLNGKQLFEENYGALSLPVADLEGLGSQEREILNSLQREDLSSDELGKLHNLDSTKMSQIITNLELLDLVKIGPLGKITLRLS